MKREMPNLISNYANILSMDAEKDSSKLYS